MKKNKKACAYNKNLIVIICVVLVLFITWTMIRTNKDKFMLFDKGTTPVYCINLASETVRREHILSTFGPYVEMVEAVDTREGKWREYMHYITDEGIRQMKRSEFTKTREQHYELTPGAVGCFLSHIKCWNKFLDIFPSDSDFVFILEDDTMPSVYFDKTFANITKDFPPLCDIILCSHLAFGEMEPIDYNGIQYKHLRPRCAFYLLNAYFITARGIKKILNDLHIKGNKFYKQLDSHLSDLINLDKITVYTLKENECFQLGISPTSIQTFTI